MVECVYCFIKHGTVRAGINPKVFKKIEELLNKIRRTSKLIVHKIKELKGKIKYEELNFLKTLTIPLNNLITRFHKEAG